MSESNRPDVPAALRDAIARDLRPVAPLQPPLVRALALVPIALVLLVASVIVFNLRVDAPALGWVLTWGASTVQMILGLLLTAAAYREAVPGTSLRRNIAALALIAALAGVIVVTWITWMTSPTRVEPRAVAFVWKACLAATVLSAMPPALISAWFVARAYPVRPLLAGALYGAGAGLMADAGWRLFCHYSDPAHVLPAHVAGILGVTVAAALATRWTMIRRLRRVAL